MGFRQRNLSPINSIKHVIDVSGSWTNATSRSVILNVVPNVDTSVFKPGDVRVGARVNGFYISIFAIGSTGAPVSGPIDWYIVKLHEGQAAAIPTPGNTGISKIRNQIFHEEKGFSGSGDGTPMVFKGVIAIPKGMRRMREGDSFEINAIVTGTDVVNFCIKCIYKSYY